MYAYYLLFSINVSRRRRKPRKGLRRKYSKRINASMLKSLESRRGVKFLNPDEIPIIPIARSRRGRNRHKRKGRIDDISVEQGKCSLLCSLVKLHKIYFNKALIN